jgi:predicted Zn-dependent peptidase
MKLTVTAFIIILALVLPAAAQAEQTIDPRTMKFAPLKFEIPKAERVVLDNGMIVHLLPDRELPLVSMTAYVGVGSIYEPADKIGLAGLTGAVMRSGGTKDIPPEKMDDELEFMASSVELSIGSDVGNASMSSLKKNLDRTLQIFSQVLMDPAFRADRLEIARKQSIEGIRRQNDDPKQVANRELTKALFRETPLGRFPTTETVKAVTREDLVNLHRKYYHPNNVILSVAGDFDRDEMLTKLNRAFSGWKKEEVSVPQVNAPNPDSKPEVLFVEKDINQSVIRMGHLGIDKNNPDLYAIRVMDSILGSSGFNSRLMTEIRTNQGLAYNVDSYFDIGRRFIGSFVAETETKAGSTAKTIGLMEEIIAGMTKAPVTDEELKLAKDSIINSFIFGFTNTAGVANQLARLEYYSYPKGYLENYRDNIAKVTKEDVLRVARKYLHPDRMVIMVVGNEKKLDKPLSTFGAVKEIKLENGK